MEKDFKMLVEAYDKVRDDENKYNTVETFIEKRSSGAKKIEHSSREKGGYSELTAIHFKAKEVPYKKSLTHLNKNDLLDYIENEVSDIHDKLKDWDKLTQKEFQILMGQMEAYGEIYIEFKNPKNYSRK